MKTSQGAPFWICVASDVELPNEYVLPGSSCCRTVVIDEPAKTIRPACECAPAPAAPSVSAAATTAARVAIRRMVSGPFLRRERVERVRCLVDGERGREREVEDLAAGGAREVRLVLGLAGGDLREPGLDRVGLQRADRAEVRAEHDRLELQRLRDDRLGRRE